MINIIIIIIIDGDWSKVGFQHHLRIMVCDGTQKLHQLGISLYVQAPCLGRNVLLSHSPGFLKVLID